jgi:hypothetical protein
MCPCTELIKHYDIEECGGVEVISQHSLPQLYNEMSYQFHVREENAPATVFIGGCTDNRVG